MHSTERDAAGRYAAILHEIETCLDPEVADDLEDLRVEAEAARVDAVRQMTRRFLRDHETALRTSMMTHEQSSAARATHTRQRHRMTSAAIRFIDQVRIAANECLDEGRMEGEPASDVRAMLLALEEEAVGLGWHLRRMNQLDGAAIESGVYTWPRSPSSRSNRG